MQASDRRRKRGGATALQDVAETDLAVLCPIGPPLWMCGSCGESTGAGCGSCQGVGRQRRGPCARESSTHRTADRKGSVKLLRVVERARESLELH